MTQILSQPGKSYLALTCPCCNSMLGVYPGDIVYGEKPTCECPACKVYFVIKESDIPKWFEEKGRKNAL